MAPQDQLITSDDGAYIIQLGEAIQAPLSKHLGTTVGVYNAKLITSPRPVDVKAEAAKKAGHLARYLQYGAERVSRSRRSRVFSVD
jgi:hypothetical protein